MIVEQGGIDEGEDPRNAAMRELREETGVASAEVLAEVWMCNFQFCTIMNLGRFFFGLLLNFFVTLFNLRAKMSSHPVFPTPCQAFYPN